MGLNDDLPNDPGSLESPTQSPGGEPTFSDDGLDAGERAAFESMRSETPITTVDPEPDPSLETPPAPAKAKTTPADGDPAADGADDDDDADADDEPSGDGQTEQQREQRRINFQKHRRILKKRDEQIEALRVELQKREVRDAKLNERLAILDEAMRTPPAPAQTDEDPEPPEDDVFESVAWLRRQNARLAKQVEEVRTGVQQTSTEQKEEQAFRSYYAQDVQGIRQSDPNFDEAYTFLMLSRDRELEAMGYKDANARRQMIVNDERRIVKKAMDEWRESGQPTSAAQRLVALAVARGYKPGVLAQQGAPEPGAGAEATTPAKPNGKAPAAPGAAPAARPSVKDEVTRLREAREANQSLSDAGGSPAPVLTTETMLNLSDDEFGDLIDKLPKDKLKELMGA